MIIEESSAITLSLISISIREKLITWRLQKEDWSQALKLFKLDDLLVQKEFGEGQKVIH
jgi:hypothetical protein